MTHEVEEVYNSSLYDWAKQMLTININYVRSAAKIIETLKIPITSVRRIIYQDAPIPQNLQKLFQAERPVSIEMNDGSLTLLTKTLVVNIDAQGNIARSIESTDSSFYPRGVSGSITTQAGTKEKFYIDGEKIKSLEFHHPLIPIPTPLLTSATPTPVKLRATIIDKTGTEYKVENPTAYYRAGGRWIIGPPSSTEAGLNIEISKITGAATVTEVINIPFTQLKRATFTDTQIQQSLQTLFKAEKPISIERNDGSLTLISKTLLVDSDAQRKITRSVGLTSYSFVVKDHGYNCYLDTFNGGATTQYGTEQVTISFDDAKSIEIEQP